MTINLRLRCSMLLAIGLFGTLERAAMANSASEGGKDRGPEEITLGPKDKLEILKVLCTGTVETDRKGPVCIADEEGDWGGSGCPDWEREMRFSAAWRGKFVAAADEWLVSLEGSCRTDSIARPYIMKHRGVHWEKIQDLETWIGHQCVPIRGMRGGFDWLACITDLWIPPYYGQEWLAIHSFVPGQESESILLELWRGGLCLGAGESAAEFSPFEPVSEYIDDQLVGLSGADGGSETALTITLEVRRSACDSGSEESGKGPTHKLRFLKRDREVVPDEASAAIIKTYGGPREE